MVKFRSSKSLNGMRRVSKPPKHHASPHNTKVKDPHYHGASSRSTDVVIIKIFAAPISRHHCLQTHTQSGTLQAACRRRLCGHGERGGGRPRRVLRRRLPAGRAPHFRLALLLLELCLAPLRPECYLLLLLDLRLALLSPHRRPVLLLDFRLALLLLELCLVLLRPDLRLVLLLDLRLALLCPDRRPALLLDLCLALLLLDLCLALLRPDRRLVLLLDLRLALVRPHQCPVLLLDLRLALLE